ncbi:transcription factor-like protein [Corchorus olitorius]|uniref:Transcription factor-like protein n=1 Tax=Corchorus olitorius TaxID=93759 RepID=A0A1R3HK12_9ROSI|nr:transcription factor-like protein [Corchorus olitorius]
MDKEENYSFAVFGAKLALNQIRLAKRSTHHLKAHVPEVHLGNNLNRLKEIDEKEKN